MKSLLPGALALTTLISAPAFAAEQVIRLEVGGLTCPSCPLIVSKSLKSVESVVIEDFVKGEDASEGLYTVRFDDEVTSADALVAEVEKNGYPVKLMPDAETGKGS
jgi:mercuric ion binding protein